MLFMFRVLSLLYSLMGEGLKDPDWTLESSKSIDWLTDDSRLMMLWWVCSIYFLISGVIREFSSTMPRFLRFLII
jgi:hypothetical protein